MIITNYFGKNWFCMRTFSARENGRKIAVATHTHTQEKKTHEKNNETKTKTEQEANTRKTE